MSELVPWDDDYRPSRPATVEEAIKQTTLWMPRPYRAQFVDLFVSLERLAHERGKPWGIETSSSLAYRIRMAIDDYRQKDASHGLEPSKVERTLRSSQGLPHKLKAILRSEEGQERFASILEQGYIMVLVQIELERPAPTEQQVAA